ncbi:hypothetical protein [Roseivirga seohaensis]|uniref:hypothetical protein n=1 Tax=Roseivirga seohaensis TaxID=1914963 RepID=UPI003BA94C5E
MRRSLLVLLSLSMSYCLMAQEPVKQQEAGLTFYNIDGFGLTYRTGTEQSLWRFNTLIISGNNSDNSTGTTISKDINTGFNFKVGKEYRKELADKLELRYGGDISFSYRQVKTQYENKLIPNDFRSSNRTIYEPGVNIIVGFNYMLKENLILGAEILPSFNYFSVTLTEKDSNTNNGIEMKADTSGYNYGLSNGSALLSLAFRF